MSTKNIRIFLETTLKEDFVISLEKTHAHYLINVLRLKAGDYLSVFNGREGEWQAKIEVHSKRDCTLHIIHSTKSQPKEPHRGLIFSPIRPNRLEFMIEKATELGITDFYPILTAYTSFKKLNIERLFKISTEASEQSERLTIPRFHPLIPLETFLDNWDKNKLIYAGIERIQSQNKVVLKEGKDDYATLVGPEGGFSPPEIDKIINLPFIQSITLGNHILRAETAAIALIILSSFNFQKN